MEREIIVDAGEQGKATCQDVDAISLWREESKRMIEEIKSEKTIKRMYFFIKRIHAQEMG